MKEVKEHTLVYNTKAVNNIPPYTKGTIVHIYSLESSVVSVEFVDDNGKTIGVENISTDDLTERK